jgi:hypothetical protein
MLCDFAIKHCNQGLTFGRWFDTGSAHDIGCGQRLPVQAVVRVIVWFHRCAYQGYAREQSLRLPVGQNVGVRRTGRGGAGASRCRRIRAHLGLSVQNLIYDSRIHEQEDEITRRATYRKTSANTADRIHRRRLTWNDVDVDVDLDQKIVRIAAKPQWNWKPKDCEERSLPIPEWLAR